MQGKEAEQGAACLLSAAPRRPAFFDCFTASRGPTPPEEEAGFAHWSGEGEGEGETENLTPFPSYPLPLKRVVVEEGLELSPSQG